MEEAPVSITTLVIQTLRDFSGVDRPIDPQSRLCAGLGVCDDDLSDLVEELFQRLGLDLPEGTTILPVDEDNITVTDVAQFLADWGEGGGTGTA